MAATHRIKMKNSDAKAEEVGKETIEFLTKNRLIGSYDVEELKPVSKPAELDSKAAKGKAE